MDPADVHWLIGESLAAHTRMLQASNVRAEALIILEARKALAALLAAVALDPGRTLPAWASLSPRDRVAVSNRMVPFYEQLNAEGVAKGL